MTDIIEIYLNRYKVLCPEISDEELVFIKSNLTITVFGKNSFYLKAGKVQKNLGFIYSGLTRAFYFDHNGDEITMGFIKENEYVTHYSSFSEQKPSRYSFQCLEECKIINLPYEKVIEGTATYKNLERYARIFKEGVADFQQSRIESLLQESAEQRYLNFIKKHPELFNRISLTHLASFLGIGRQSLSRIRKKLATK